MTLYLPRQVADPLPPAAAAGQPPQPREQVGHGETVLLVEDDAQVRSYTTEAVAELGFRVLAASDAEAALRIFDDHPDVALLFTDIGLPGLDGRQLAEEAVRRRPGLRVVFTTGYEDSAAVHTSLRDRGFHLIAKPFAFDSLAAKLREVMRRP